VRPGAAAVVGDIDAAIGHERVPAGGNVDRLLAVRIEDDAFDAVESVRGNAETVVAGDRCSAHCGVIPAVGATDVRACVQGVRRGRMEDKAGAITPAAPLDAVQGGRRWRWSWHDRNRAACTRRRGAPSPSPAAAAAGQQDHGQESERATYPGMQRRRLCQDAHLHSAHYEYHVECKPSIKACEGIHGAARKLEAGSEAPKGKAADESAAYRNTGGEESTELGPVAQSENGPLHWCETNSIPKIPHDLALP
jgi:hypothetical protein